MDSSDPLPLLTCISDNFAKKKERTPFNQVLTLKVSHMQRIIQMMQRVAQKSCIRACELFCLPLDSLMCEKALCCSAQNQQSKEDKNTQVALRSPPSTILILNISNSTLVDCVIGNEAYLSAATEHQPLMQKSEHVMHDQVGCSWNHGLEGATQTTPPPPPPPLPPSIPSTEHLNISIHSSHLNYVIIGDNNYMQSEQILPSD